jgi:DNA-directed RNA polymerase I subunit RPA1
LGEDIKKMRLTDVPGLEEHEAEEDGANVQDVTIRARELYVRHTLQQHVNEINLGDIRRDKHEGASEMRRQLVKEFLAMIVSEKKCRGCGGLSPTFRRDRYTKIFERDLSVKEKAAMAQAGRKRADALFLTRKAKRSEFAQDEAIADVDLSSNNSEEEPESEGDSEGDGEDLDENGDVVMGEAAPQATKKPEMAKPPRAQRFISSMEVKERLNLLFEKEQEILSLLYNSKPRPRNAKPLTASMFFLQTLLVPPNRYRPEV